MSFDTIIAWYEQILTLIALIGVVWSAIEYFKSQRKTRAIEAERRVADWRKIAIHEIVARASHFMSVSDIVGALRSNSFDTELDIQKTDLTDTSVRSVLMEMVSSGIVAQIYPDRYGLVQNPRSASQDLAQEKITLNQVVREAYAIIHMNDGVFKSEDLQRQIDTAKPYSLTDFELMLLELERIFAAERGENERWKILKNKKEVA